MSKTLLLAGASALFFAESAFALQPADKPLSPDAQKLAEQVHQTQKQVAAATEDVETRAKAEALIEKAENFLRSRQDKATGAWSLPKLDKDNKPLGPTFPAFTALALNGLLMNPTADPEKDAVIAAGVKYLLDAQKPDGSIYVGMLPEYNTSLSVSALSKVHTARSREAVEKALAYLRTLQWSELPTTRAAGADSKPVQRDHPYYGGVGYGKHSRPDNSNLNTFIDALQDAGVSPQDEAVKRAVVFLQRTQMDDRVNDMPYAKGSRQGGFIYSTIEDAQSVETRSGNSEAGNIEETLSDGTTASRLRAYGSMTYAGFKAYIYAELPRTDQRVALAYDWIRRNYSVNENPGIGSSGQYYYYVVFARALRSWGEPTIKLLTPKNTPTGEERNWRKDLVEKLAELQKDDGSFKSVSDRWLETNPDLITAYALIALRQAVE